MVVGLGSSGPLLPVDAPTDPPVELGMAEESHHAHRHPITSVREQTVFCEPAQGVVTVWPAGQLEQVAQTVFAVELCL